MRMEHMMAVAAGYRRKPFIPQAYDLLTYVRLAGQEIYETGTEHDVKRIASVPDAGSAGGALMQSTVANRPVAVQFAAGKAMYFDGTDSLQSTAPASAFRALHTGEQPVRGGFAFRPTQLHTEAGSILFATSGNSVDTVGMYLSIETNRSLSWTNFNGASGGDVPHVSSPGLVSAGSTYVITYDVLPTISGPLARVWLNGELVIEGVRPSPNMSNPRGLSLCQFVSSSSLLRLPLIGYLAEPMIFVGARLPERAALEDYLSQFTLDDSRDQLIDQYKAEGSLVHAYVPESIQSSEGVVTAWEDVVSGAHLTVDIGAPTVTTLDGVPAVDFTSGSGLLAHEPAALVTGSQPFSVVSWARAAYDPNEGGSVFSIEFYGESDGHWMFADHIFVDSLTSAGRYTADVAEEAASVLTTDEQRFRGHSFREAGSAFNLWVVDDVASSPALNVPSVDVDTTVVYGLRAEASHVLLFNRALNIGELMQWRHALETAAFQDMIEVDDDDDSVVVDGATDEVTV